MYDSHVTIIPSLQYLFTGKQNFFRNYLGSLGNPTGLVRVLFPKVGAAFAVLCFDSAIIAFHD